MFKSVPEKDLIEITEDYVFHYKSNNYWIPKGFRFDGASIPRAFWSIIGSPFHPDYIEAALVHDWCFATWCLNFKETNAVFKRNLKNAGVGYIRRILMWSAVNTVGYYFYRKKEQSIINYIKSLIDTRDDREKFYRHIKAF